MDSRERSAALLEKREVWRRHVEGWQASDISQREYCRRHEPRYSQFVYWKKKYLPASNPDPSSAIIELPPFSRLGMIAGSGLRVVVGSGHRIAVDRDFDPVTLGQLIDALDRLQCFRR
jgi:hypothetical protein